MLTDKKIGRKCGPPCEVMDLWIKQKKLNFELEFRKKSKKKKKKFMEEIENEPYP